MAVGLDVGGGVQGQEPRGGAQLLLPQLPVADRFLGPAGELGPGGLAEGERAGLLRQEAGHGECREVLGLRGQGPGSAAGQAQPVGRDQLLQGLLGSAVGEPAGDVLAGDVPGAVPGGAQGEQEDQEVDVRLGVRGVIPDVLEDGTGVYGVVAGQQPLHWPVRVAGGESEAVGVHVPSGLCGARCPLGLVAQRSVAGGAAARRLAGVRGGWLECVEITAADGYHNTTCLWGDKGSFGRVTIVGPDLADRADSLTRELRAALVHPTVGAEAQSS
nr:hypothetical protein OG409_38035 [Streptomyces sp. NBC_00974]